jgi:hypothetical protein
MQAARLPRAEGVDRHTPAVCCAHVRVGVHSEEPMAEVRWATRGGREKMLMAKKKRRWVRGSDRVCELSM